jgi:lactate dehydrogenase-like 2-hydroxyacid dehydrogenase
VAEHAVGLILALNRKQYRAYQRIREGHFGQTGLLSFDLHGRTAGVVGTGRIGALGLDAHEERSQLFVRDLSDQVIQDDVFARLLTCPNVLLTAHQGYFTREALLGSAATTAANLSDAGAGRPDPNCGPLDAA